MRAFLFTGGVIALLGALILAFLPVTGEESFGIPGTRIGTPLDITINCGSVADQLRQPKEMTLAGGIALLATNCTEELQTRMELVAVVGVGGGIAIAAGLVVTVLLALWELVALLLVGLWRVVRWFVGLFHRDV